MRTWALQRPSGVVVTGDEVLLGRARELELLGSAYAGAVKGRPFAVLIEGDPGIGKTALLRTFLSGLADEAHVLLATADEGEQDRPFALLHQLVVGTDGVLARRFADVVAGRTAPPEALAAGVDLLAEIGRLQVDGQPVVIALDDVHWADRPSLGSLVFALRRLRVDNVLAVMTIRSGEGTRLPAGLLRLASDPTGFSLPVGGLAIADLETLGSTVSTVPLTPRTARRLHEATAGNPLYAMTLLQELGPQSLDDDRPLPLPPSLTLLLLARLSGCGQPSIRLVQAVSILGGRPYLAIVAQLAALDDPHAAFEEAEHAGLLARDHVDPQRVEFSHPLICAAVYSDLSVSTRSALHRRAAAVTSGETALEHRVRASGSVDRALAEELRSLASAEAAEGRWGSAGRHLIASSRLHPSPEVREASLLRAAVMLAAGPDPGAVAALEDEVRQQPPSAWRGFILAHLAMSAGHVGEATTRLEDALDRSDPDQEPEIVAITAFLLAACRLLQGGRGRETAELSRLALRLAPVGSPARLAWVTVLYGEAIAGRPTAALEMVPDLESLPPGVERAAVVLGRAMVRLYTDDLDGARDDLSQVQGAFVRDRPGPMTWPVCTNLAEVDFRAGRWDDALAHAELGISVATDMDDTLAVGFHSAIIAAIHAYRGEWSAAREAHAVIERQAAATGLGASRIHAAMAGVRIAHAREAADVLIEASRPLVELSGEDAVKEHGAFPWRDLRAEALVRLERFDEAEAMVDELERHGSQRRLRSAEVAAARVRGALEAARGHSAEARDAYQRGLEASLDLGMPLLRGLLLLDYGRFARRRGGRRDSVRLLDEAAEIFRGIGSEPFVERCVRELGATGRRRARRGESHLELTQQEYAVARLVMDGLSNREVAAELVISVKTVEYHLSNLYSKVGVASRTQLMARFGDGGLRIGRSS